MPPSQPPGTLSGAARPATGPPACCRGPCRLPHRVRCPSLPVLLRPGISFPTSLDPAQHNHIRTACSTCSRSKKRGRVLRICHTASSARQHSRQGPYAAARAPPPTRRSAQTTLRRDVPASFSMTCSSRTTCRQPQRQGVPAKLAMHLLLCWAHWRILQRHRWGMHGSHQQ